LKKEQIETLNVRALHSVFLNFAPMQVLSVVKSMLF